MHDPKIDDPKIDDRFLRDLKAQPSPEFAARLRATLRALPPNAVARVAPAAGVTRWFAAAASIAVVGLVFTLPPVQAAAEAFLDLFRVKQFTGVQFDPERLKDLEGSGFNPEALFGGLVEPLTPPQEPASYATADDAGAAAGIRVRTPAYIPQGFVSTGFMASSEVAARITVDTASLQALLDALGLADVELPQGLDGQTATVRLPPVVTQTFVNRDPERTDRTGAILERSVHVIQAESPDVSFPAGLDLSKLAYAGLRVLGMSRDEAYRMSVTIDWRTTLIVPVPAKAVAYRPLNVSGNEGLLIEGLAAGERFPGGVLMWSSGGETFAVAGAVSAEELLEIAQTLQ
jgi:hypothetical protein